MSSLFSLARGLVFEGGLSRGRSVSVSILDPSYKVVHQASEADSRRLRRSLAPGWVLVASSQQSTIDDSSPL